MMIRKQRNILLLLMTLLVYSQSYGHEGNIESATTGFYDNPVLKDIDAPDGCIWRDSTTKTFYAFYSIQNDNSKHIYKSQNLVDWTDTGKPAFTEEDFHKIVSGTSEPSPTSIGLWLWAPQVIYRHGKYLMYIAIAGNDSCKIHSGIAVLSSDNPDGYFRFHGIVSSYGGYDSLHYPSNGIYCSIDPYPVADEKGRLWLFFGSVGQVYRIRLADDGLSVFPGAHYQLMAGSYSRGNPNKSRLCEGTYLYKHHGYWYLFASRGQYNDYSYSLVVARSKTLGGPFVNRKGIPMTRGGFEVILHSRRGDAWYGCGHNGEIYQDKTGHNYICYHCHGPESKYHINSHGDQYRYLMLQEIFWGQDGWPYFRYGRPQIYHNRKPVF
ncbi:MAG: family 43 glycosylhydrolase [Prevotella sp.]|nr:family 43 glycosylhydrolase [Prevotella sp.]